MAKQTIDISTPQVNGRQGEAPRTAFTKVNQNFDELYDADEQSLKKDQNLNDVSNAATARSNLGLGTAATMDVTTSETDVTVGRIPTTRWLGMSGRDYATTRTQQGFIDLFTETRFSSGASGYEFPLDWPGGYVIGGGPSTLSSLKSGLLISTNGGRAGIFGGVERGDTNLPVLNELYHTGNTTKNPDGTLKASSPVISLYTDKHDLHSKGQFGATPTVVRKSKGVYEITGTLGLRSEGWYLDTPSDRNGNKYFNIEWTQNITPDSVDGVVDEYRDDIVVTIETFERVWNPQTGIHENGNPVDINEHQGRYVSLRFNELRKDETEIPLGGDDVD